MLGWLVGIGSLAIPGVGPFIAAGPIMAALAGAGVGAAVGGLSGALIGLGIPQYEAKQYEGKIKAGTFSFPSTRKTAMKLNAQRTSLSMPARMMFPPPEKKASLIKRNPKLRRLSRTPIVPKDIKVNSSNSKERK